MANGFCPYLLQHIASIAGSATPQYKVNAHGFLDMLHTAGNPDAIKVSNYDGHKKTVNVAYRKRFTKAQTTTSFTSCDSVLEPSKTEAVVSVANVRALAIHIEDELIAQYCNDASAMVAAKGATPPTSIMNEIADIIFSAGNALLQGVNEDLLGLVTWGKNVVEGNNAATSVNFPQDLTVQPLTGGMTKVLSDYSVNNLAGRPQIVGSGLSYNYFLQQAFKQGVDFGGFDSRLATAMADYYHDRDFTTVGTNQFGVFEPGSVQLVQYLQNKGFKAGEKPGGSVFGVLPLPMVDPTNQMMKTVKFDFQFKYVDCPQDYTDSYSGATVNLERGWSIILIKQFGLWQIPSDAYRNEDPQFSVNGALRYTATNSCDNCE